MLSFKEFLEEDVFKSSSPCMPLAIQKLTGASKKVINDFCMAPGVGGKRWTEKRGMDAGYAAVVLHELGFKTNSRFDLMFKDVPNKIWPDMTDKQRRTLNELLKVVPKRGKFLVSVKRHAVAIVNGKLYDDANVGRKRQVQEVQEVTK
jgi:hypothetical protein